MKYINYFVAGSAIAALAFLLFANAVTLIFIICAILCTSSIVVYVLIYYLKFIEENKEPKRIIIESNIIEERNNPDNYDSNKYLHYLKSYFENRYTNYPTKIVYFFEENVHTVYISTENHRDFRKIQEIITEIFSYEKVKVLEGLPTI